MTGGAAAPRALRVLELFCGIGGCAAALRDLAPDHHRVVAAIDVNTLALDVYRHNFPSHRTLARTLDSIEARELLDLGADLWWLSPPCQPFTRRGLRRDDEDPRARPLLALIECLETLAAEARPLYLALENVPGFEGSRCHSRLCSVLDRAGYVLREQLLCPSELGWPNRRRRYYLVAARGPLVAARRPAARRPAAHRAGPAPVLAELLDDEPEAGLEIPADLAERYRHALHRVRRDDPAAVTACFTSAYGRSPVRSGSYVETETGLRRLAPREILALLGFPPTYRLPPALSREAAWRLVGNSLSLPAVRTILSQIPTLTPEPSQ